MYFYPRSPCGERPVGIKYRHTTVSISIHALLAESDGRKDDGAEIFGISIHALLAESDHFPGADLVRDSQFLSTLSLRRATAAIGKPTLEIAYFYPRSPCGERLSPNGGQYSVYSISIHALLAESDNTSPGAKSTTPISIHALLAESDQLGAV